MRPLALLTAAAFAAATLASSALSAPQPKIPASFYPQVLCVHAGWYFREARRAERRHADYRLGGRFWIHASHVASGHGEGSWTGTVGNEYGGGLSFMVGTWNNAAKLSGGAVPYLSSTWAIAREPPSMQILAAYYIVRQDGDWHEWPNTSAACGLRR